MSYFGIKFELDENLLKDKELVDLYRNRDNDEYYQKHKALTITNHSTRISEDGKAFSMLPNHYRNFFNPSWDKIWSSMTDEERIENGLTTNFYYKYFTSPVALVGILVLNSIMI
jgi:hypothetical protein